MKFRRSENLGVKVWRKFPRKIRLQINSFAQVYIWLTLTLTLRYQLLRAPLFLSVQFALKDGALLVGAARGAARHSSSSHMRYEIRSGSYGPDGWRGLDELLRF